MSSKETDRAKLRNIIDMAISFSAMSRVFEEGSTETIKKELYRNIQHFFCLKNKKEYLEKHTQFCNWFVKNVKIAERKRNGRRIKKSEHASYGHAAKVIDIVLKVCIYYCYLPNEKTAQRIIPWLNAAIDTALLEDLRKRYHRRDLAGTRTIEDIDRTRYELLQKLVRADIETLFSEAITPVKYDDIKWRELHGK